MCPQNAANRRLQSLDLPLFPGETGSFVQGSGTESLTTTSANVPTSGDRHGEALIFDRQFLLNSLLRVKNQGSLNNLRAQVLQLKNLICRSNLDGGELLDVGRPEDSTVTFHLGPLIGELDQIASSQTIERAAYYVDRLMKGVAELKTNDLNDINLNRWKEYDDIITDSLWLIDKRDNSGVHSAGYWGNFIPQIPNQMLKRYTKQGEWVLDTFAGCGTTLIESQRLGRNGIGLELQPDIAERARSLIAAERNPHNVRNEVIVGDSSALDYLPIMRQRDCKSVQLVIMHPPYHDIITFSDDPRDLSNAPSVDSFLEGMRKVVEKASLVLDRGRYLVLVIGDKYAKGEWVPLGFLTMNQIMNQGFKLKSVIVKNFEDTTAKRNQKELWRYRALVGGFYVFKHEYVFLFKKS